LLPLDLRARVSNVEIVVDDEPPPLSGARPQSGRSANPTSRYYGGVLPDKITIYRGPLVRLYGHDTELLGREVRRVVPP